MFPGIFNILRFILYYYIALYNSVELRDGGIVFWFIAEVRSFSLLYKVQTRPEAHTASYIKGTTGYPPRDQASGS
jgi:hypothetical protein